MGKYFVFLVPQRVQCTSRNAVECLFPSASALFHWIRFFCFSPQWNFTFKKKHNRSRMNVMFSVSCRYRCCCCIRCTLFSWLVCLANKIPKFYRWHEIKLAELFDGINWINRSICDMQNSLQKLSCDEVAMKRGEGQQSLGPKQERNQSPMECNGWRS